MLGRNWKPSYLSPTGSETDRQTIPNVGTDHPTDNVAGLSSLVNSNETEGRSIPLRRKKGKSKGQLSTKGGFATCILVTF